MIYVIAGNYEQFIYCLREKNLPIKQTRYLSRPEQLRGLHNVTPILYGEYWKNPCYQDPYLRVIRER